MLLAVVFFKTRWSWTLNNRVSWTNEVSLHNTFTAWSSPSQAFRWTLSETSSDALCLTIWASHAVDEPIHHSSCARSRALNHMEMEFKEPVWWDYVRCLSTRVQDNDCLYIFARQTRRLADVVRLNTVSLCFLMPLICDFFTQLCHLICVQNFSLKTCVPLFSSQVIIQEKRQKQVLTYVTYMLP
jgi:hypothetical protein